MSPVRREEAIFRTPEELAPAGVGVVWLSTATGLHPHLSPSSH